MSDSILCDDKDLLVAYLYDELDEAARRQMEDHLRICGACAAELGDLRGVRQELASWTPPDARLDVTLAPAAEVPRADVVRPARWSGPAAVPAWAQAAAAVLVIGAGLGLANLQVRYGADGLVLTTGWMAPAPAPTPAPSGAAQEADWRPALAELESTLRSEMAARASAPQAAVAPTAAGSQVSIDRVAELIGQSERRQRRELALRLTQFSRDLEVQRRSDLVRINQGLGQFEGRAGAEMQRQRQMLDFIMRVSATPPPQ